MPARCLRDRFRDDLPSPQNGVWQRGFALIWLGTALACVHSPTVHSTTEGDDETSATNDAACDDWTGDAASLRQLTPVQLSNTLHDLFPDISLPPMNLVGIDHRARFDHLANLQQPSVLWVYQLHQIAVEVAARVVADDPRFKACLALQTDEAWICGQDAIAALAKRAFRRPMAKESSQDYREYLGSLRNDYSLAIALQLALQSLLQDPRLIYLVEFADEEVESPPESDAVGPYALASRLAYFLWNSMPDDELLRAATAGELSDRPGIRRQAQRLLADPRGQNGLLHFFAQTFEWYKIDGLAARKTELPQLDFALEAAMHEELNRQILATVWQGSGRWRDLLLTSDSEINATLASIYRVDPPQGQAWETRHLDPDQRAGILTSAGFLASHAVHVDPSPVRRGIFVLDRLLCRPPPLPNAAIDLSLPVDPTKAQTNRERFTAHVADPACAGCHQSIDPIGFAFEAYDALGQIRANDAGRAIDDSGEITLDGKNHRFNGVVALAELLADSHEVESCIVQSWLSYAVARPIESLDACEFEPALQTFREHGGNLRELLLDIATSPAFARKGAYP